MNEWQIAKEVLLSVIKWFLLFIVVNNIVWLIIVLSSTPSELKGNIEQVDSSNIKQEIKNG